MNIHKYVNKANSKVLHIKKDEDSTYCGLEVKFMQKSTDLNNPICRRCIVRGRGFR